MCDLWVSLQNSTVLKMLICIYSFSSLWKQMRKEKTKYTGRKIPNFSLVKLRVIIHTCLLGSLMIKTLTALLWETVQAKVIVISYNK